MDEAGVRSAEAALPAPVCKATPPVFKPMPPPPVRCCPALPRICKPCRPADSGYYLRGSDLHARSQEAGSAHRGPLQHRGVSMPGHIGGEGLALASTRAGPRRGVSFIDQKKAQVRSCNRASYVHGMRCAQELTKPRFTPCGCSHNTRKRALLLSHERGAAGERETAQGARGQGCGAQGTVTAHYAVQH